MFKFHEITIHVQFLKTFEQLGFYLTPTFKGWRRKDDANSGIDATFGLDHYSSGGFGWWSLYG